MAAIDLERLSNPISEDSPSGDNLEHDPALGELARAAEGQPEKVMGDSSKDQKNRGGAARIEAVPPQWDSVMDQATELLERGRDLRVVIYIARALLNLHGLTEFANGIQLLSRTIQNLWDSVYPQLDAEDNNDPTERMNTLLALTDRAGLLKDLAHVPLARSRLGEINLRSIRVATGEASPVEGEEELDAGLIDAAFMETDVEDLKAQLAATGDAASALEEMRSFMLGKVDTMSVPDLSPLLHELATIRKLFADKLAARGVDMEPEGDAEAAADEVPGTAAPAGGGIGDIRGREDVVRVLDKISDYYRKNEPSSPVPLLLERAKRLVSKDFLGILEDLAPEGLASARGISGSYAAED